MRRILIGGLITWLFLCSWARAGYFGNTNTPMDGYENIESYQFGSKFICDSTATLDSIYVYLGITTSDSRDIKCAIYHAGDSSLVDSTTIRTIAEVDTAWYGFEFVAGATVFEADSYFLMAWAENTTGAVQFFYDYYSSQGKTVRSPYQSSWVAWPDPFTRDYSSNTMMFSVYATYITAEEGGRKCAVRH